MHLADLEEPVDSVNAARYLACTPRYLRDLCRYYGIPKRYRRYKLGSKGPFRRPRILWPSEISYLQHLHFHPQGHRQGWKQGVEPREAWACRECGRACYYHPRPANGER